MKTIHVDIETYSDVNLRDHGVYKYSESPSFKILLLAYAVDDGPIEIVDLAAGEEISSELEYLLTSPDVKRKAFNAQFERVCLSKILPPAEWECSMIKANYLGLRGTLENVGTALGLPPDKQKLTTGKNLIRLFSIPRKPTKTNGMRTVYTHEDLPEEWEKFRAYCVNDVEAERAIDNKLSFYKLSNIEKQIYQLDQKINDRGVALDLDLVEAAIEVNARQNEIYEAQYEEITGIETPRKLGQLKDWIKTKTGQEVTAITKNNQELLMEDFKSYPDVVEALKIRQNLSRSSVAKYDAMLRYAGEDTRARGLFQFYGAATGRWAGRGFQPQNLPRNYMHGLEVARKAVRERSWGLLELLYEDPPDVMSQLIRTAIIPSPGKRFLVSDFSAIEARVLAWLAGEEWVLEVFRDTGLIYEATASRMFGVPMDKVDRPLRSKGKVATLALGYQGSVGALKQMGALNSGLTEDELPGLVNYWREANSKIVSFWWDLDQAARKCITERTNQEVRGLRLSYHHGMFFIRLPSGRELAYPKATIRPHQKFEDSTEIAYCEVSNGGGWKTTGTYGGKLTENVTQAIARDCLVDSMLRIEDAGYKIVMHIHDEVVIECEADKDPEAALEDIYKIMGTPIPWAPGLPLGADGFHCMFYQKD